MSAGAESQQAGGTLVRLAAALLERIARRRYAEAIAGDLLEELRAGRTNAWFWRELLQVIVMQGVSAARTVAGPVVFSLAWSLLYPVWQGIWWRSPLARGVFDRWSRLDWPASALLLLGGGLVPVMTFLWLGIFVYLLMRTEAPAELSPVRVAAGLSLSLSVLLVVSMGLLSVNTAPDAHVQPMGWVVFYGAPYRVAESVAPALSVLVGILAARPRVRHLRVG